MELKSLKNAKMFSKDAKGAQVAAYHAMPATEPDSIDIVAEPITDAAGAIKFPTDLAWSSATSATSSRATAAGMAITGFWAVALSATLIGSVKFSIDNLPIIGSKTII